MTFSNQTNRTSAVGSGSIGQEIPFLFPINATSDLVVYKLVTSTGVQTTLAETTNYTVAIDGDDGGTVTTVTAIETTESIHIVRDTPNTQELDLEQGGSFNAENIEDALDKNTKLGIENKDLLSRIPQFPATDPSSSLGDYPNSIDRASLVAGWDSAGKPNAQDAVPTGSVSFTTIGTSIAEAADVPAVRSLIADGDFYDVDSFPDFSSALSDIGADEAELHIYTEQAVITDETVPATLVLVIHRGGSLSISGSKTVTVNGPMIAGPYKIFTLASAGNDTIEFGAGVSPVYYAEWFGAAGDGSTDDYDAWNALSAAYPAGAELVLVEGQDYLLKTAATLDFPLKCIISGTGTFTIDTLVGDRHAIDISGSGTIIRDISIVGDMTGFVDLQNDNGRVTLYLGTGSSISDILLDNITMTNSVYAIRWSGPDNITIQNCKIVNTTLDVDFGSTVRHSTGIFGIADSENVIITGNYISGFGTGIESGFRNKGWTIADNVIERQGDNGMYFTGNGYSVTGNSLSDMTGHAIVAYCGNITITGNNVFTRLRVETTISSTEASGQTILSLTSTTGMTAGDHIAITLDNGDRFKTDIASVDSSIQVTVDDALPSQADTGNTVQTHYESGGIRVQGQLQTIGHVADINDNTSRAIVVSNNTMMGDLVGNVIIVQPYHSPAGSNISGYSDATIANNTIQGTDTDRTATGGSRGITLITTNDSGDTNMVSYGAVVTGNVVKNIFNGIAVAATGKGGHYFANISNNTVYLSTFLAFSLNRLHNCILSDNITYDAIGTGVTPISFTITNSEENTFSSNSCGNRVNPGTGKVDTAFKEVTETQFTFIDGDVNTGTETITETAHNLATGIACRLTTTGTLPAGLALLTTYWIIRVDANTIKLAATKTLAVAGTAVNITGAAGGGTHTLSRINTNNQYINNKTDLTTAAKFYVLNDNTGVIVTHRTVIRDLANSSSTFNPGEGDLFLIDPNGNVNYNPTGTFPTGARLTLINTAGDAETITFDSAGLNQAVAQNKRATFAYSGTAWLLIDLYLE